VYVAPRCYAPSSFLRFSGQFSCRRLAVVVLSVCICAVFEGELRGVGVSLLNGVVERRLAVFAPRVWIRAAAEEEFDVAGLSLPCRVVEWGLPFLSFRGLPLLLPCVRPPPAGL
jgi:hypothetical protein